MCTSTGLLLALAAVLLLLALAAVLLLLALAAPNLVRRARPRRRRMQAHWQNPKPQTLNPEPPAQDAGALSNP